MITLQIDSLRKTFRNKTVLSDVFLSCKEGEIKGLIGRNGSGKSTLLKIAFGTESADSKFVRVGSKVIRNISDRKNLINYLPQDSFLPGDISIRSLINLFLKKESRAVVLDNPYVKPLLFRQNQQLSSGERRLIEILLIIHSEARFILLDEPFNGISPIMKEYIINYIKNERTSKGYIITDHDYENVINLADSLVFLNNGFLKQIKDKSELVALGYMSQRAYNDVF
ncbi:MAG: ATP-binding cassette domain-containing protein [Psychroserpens sp.]|nr:ATP-binding cassette domain-containing protein [Psychroserpens sp.]